jgi:hypothetical protein
VHGREGGCKAVGWRWRAVKPYIREKNVNYRVVLGTDDMAGRYGGIEPPPTTLLIDPDGRIAAAHVAFAGKSIYEQQIGKLLGRRNRLTHYLVPLTQTAFG